MKRGWWYGVLLGILLLVMPVSGEVFGQQTIEISEDTVSIEYPYSITFALKARSTTPIDEVKLFWQAGPEEAFNVQEFTFRVGEQVDLSFPLSTQYLALPPFAQVTYRWQVRDEDGNELTTVNQSFEYVDTRQDWQELTNDHIRLLWYDLEPRFAEYLFQVADEAYLRLAADFGVELERKPVILIYPEQETFFEFQQFMANLEYVVGRYFPGHNITANLVIGEMPQELYLDTIAHELSHLYSDNFYGGYAQLPGWLEEGLATYNESEDLEDELRDVRRAAGTYTLIPFLELSESIRAADIDVSTLAYAEGATIFEFIAETWGQAALSSFLNEFRHTTSLNDVTLSQFDMTMVEFELAWRAWLGYPVKSVPQAIPTPTMMPFILPTPTYMLPGS